MTLYWSSRLPRLLVDVVLLPVTSLQKNIQRWVQYPEESVARSFLFPQIFLSSDCTCVIFWSSWTDCTEVST